MITDLQKNNAFFRQLLFLAILITIGIVIFNQLAFFIGSFLGAITIYVVVRKMYFRMIDERKWKPWLASLVMVLAIGIVILSIFYFVFKVAASEIPSVSASAIVTQFNSWSERLSEALGVNIAAAKVLEQSSSLITKVASSVFNTTYSFAINIFLMLVILYFMLIKARNMEVKILAYQPFHGKSLEMIERELHNMILSNAVVIPVILLGQGMAAALIYWLLGVDNFVFWAFITAFCGLIPMIGTAIVSVPLGVYMIMSDQVWQGITLIFCGLFVIANVDNLIRIIFMKRGANTPPLVTIFGVILGIPLFGFWGIIFGPLLISGFMLLTKIYYHEYNLLQPCDPANPGACDPDTEAFK